MGFYATDASIPALMVASVLYGINMAMFYLSLQRLLREKDDWKRWGDINFPMVAVVIALYLSSTASLSLQLTLVMRDHMYHVESRPDDFRIERSTIVVPKATLMIFETMIADSVLLFRCWIVWNKMFLAIVLPSTLWVGCLGSSIYALNCLYFRASPTNIPINVADKTFPALAAFWTCTIMVNIYCTGMIVGRICSVQQGWSPPTICSLRDIPQRSRMQFAKRIVIESAMLYTAASLNAFVNHICQSPGSEIACQAEVQMIGIAFNLILIRSSHQDQDNESKASGICFQSQTSRSTASVAVGTTDSLDDIPLRKTNTTSSV